MSDMTQEELKKILDLHKKWLNKEMDGAKANLCEADLYGANLRWANLCWANLCGADLCGANLRWANLCWADLRWANLRGANLRWADLCWANLCGADLTKTIGLTEQPVHTKIVPDVGTEIIGWKKVWIGSKPIILKLQIPSDAARTSCTKNRKCRAERAIVLESFGNSETEKVFHSQFDQSFTYRVGAIVVPREQFNSDWKEDCKSGIHFFLTREEAECYN
jgi:hypothetical protein